MTLITLASYSLRHRVEQMRAVFADLDTNTPLTSIISSRVLKNSLTCNVSHLKKTLNYSSLKVKLLHLS